MKNIYSHLFQLIKQKKTVALATVMDTKGSTPQVPGASALFSDKGLAAGTLGGGLLEGDAQQRTIRALETKKPIMYEFNLADDISSEEGAVCGGTVTILIDPIPENQKEIYQQLNSSLSRRNSGVLATLIKKVEKNEITISRAWIEKQEKWKSRLSNNFIPFQHDINAVLSSGKPKFLSIKKKNIHERTKEQKLFLEYILPLPHLIIAGAGHIGQAVVHLGHLLDFEITVIDDRAEFATSERLPEADKIIVDDIGKALGNLPVSRDTYIVIVTRGHHHDADALRQCIHSEAAYIGMIGSRRKTELMRKKFLQESWATAKQFDRVYAPIGININSTTVQEIAVSIAAQLISVRSMSQGEIKGD